MSDEERFWAKVDKGSGEGCWLWTASVRGDGDYGQIWFGGKTQRSHRVAWQLACGPIPQGLLVLHNCPDGDNPRCVNPAHLWLGTNDDNVADRQRKGRQARGVATAPAKLDAEKVRAIRAAAATGTSVSSLARFYGVDRNAIAMVVRRKTWAHVGDAS
jgi:hypothetical protein